MVDLFSLYESFERHKFVSLFLSMHSDDYYLNKSPQGNIREQSNNSEKEEEDEGEEVCMYIYAMQTTLVRGGEEKLRDFYYK